MSPLMELTGSPSAMDHDSRTHPAASADGSPVCAWSAAAVIANIATVPLSPRARRRTSHSCRSGIANEGRPEFGLFRVSVQRRRGTAAELQASLESVGLHISLH